MSEELRYTKEHEWLVPVGDGVWRVGVSDYAQEQLGDIVAVELPTANAAVTAGQACAVLESVKSASDIYAPIAGTIVKVNDQLEDAPEKVNESPTSEGWLFEIKAEGEVDLKEFMDLATYQSGLDG